MDDVYSRGETAQAMRDIISKVKKPPTPLLLVAVAREMVMGDESLRFQTDVITSIILPVILTQLK
jgi:hypothetical protein